jgi:hypothetical protein
MTKNMNMSKTHSEQLTMESEQTAGKVAVLRTRLALTKGQAMQATAAVAKWEEVYYSLYAEGAESAKVSEAVAQQVDDVVESMHAKRDKITEIFLQAENRAVDNRGNHEGLLETRQVCSLIL